AGEAAARRVIEHWCASVGRVAAGVADVFGPEVLVLGSLAERLAADAFALTEEAFLRHVHPDLRTTCRLCLPQLGNRLQDCSALAAGMQCLADVASR
ncbi:MAG: hypothetical protein AAGK78_10815, partial [Planctomycetota bacterium]